MRISRFLILAAAFTGLALSAAPLLAQDGAKITIVNIQGIMRDSTAAKAARDQLGNKQKAYESDISKKEETLKKEEQDLLNQRNVLAKEAFEEKVKTFRGKENDLRREVQTKKAVLDAAFERALGDIQKAVTDIIAELAKEKGFTIAIPSSQTLYYDASLDISGEVLKRLNERMPKLDVKFDAPAQAAPAAAKSEGKAKSEKK